MDMQPVFNERNAVTYMCQYFSKIEVSVHSPGNKPLRIACIMKTIAKAYLTNQE